MMDRIWSAITLLLLSSCGNEGENSSDTASMAGSNMNSAGSNMGGMAGETMLEQSIGGAGTGMGAMGGTLLTGDNSISFETDVYPIFLAKCAPCHDADHSSMAVEVAYDATQLRIGGETEPPVYEVILMRTISTDPSVLMPPSYASPACTTFNEGGCLTQEEWNIIDDWAQEGAMRE